MKIKREVEQKIYYSNVVCGQVVEVDNNEIVIKIPDCTDDKKVYNAVSLSGGNDTLVKTLCFVKPNVLVTKLDCELHIL